MTDDELVDEAPAPDPEPHIFLPPQPGHRRACLRFRNGITQEIDMQPEELADELDVFLADASRPRLELRDAKFGEYYSISRHVVEEEVLDVLVAWVQNPAPEEGRRSTGVVVAREMPEAHRQRERDRRLRQLN